MPFIVQIANWVIPCQIIKAIMILTPMALNFSSILTVFKYTWHKEESKISAQNSKWLLSYKVLNFPVFDQILICDLKSCQNKFTLQIHSL